jgi:hypothetical protein
MFGYLLKMIALFYSMKYSNKIYLIAKLSEENSFSFC